ncbi:MAG: hypothetical protein WC911_07830 [Thermoleophilia bacterium]
MRDQSLSAGNQLPDHLKKQIHSHPVVLAGIIVAVSLVFAVFGAAVASAVPPAVSPAVAGFNEAADYSSEAFADPFDFGNAEDLNLTPNVATFNVSNVTMNGGNLAFDAAPGGMIQPVQSGAFPHGRDSDIYTLDASKYSRLSIRMYSSLNYPVAGGILWFNCWGFNGSCEGAMSFLLQPGWNTYDLQLTPNLMGIPWSGAMKSILIEPSASAPVHVEIDWMRLYQPAGSVNLTVQGDYASEVWWDSDSNPANNDSSVIGGKGAGRLSGYVANGGTVSFPASAYPPGAYRFYTKQNGQVSAYSNPLTLNAKPDPLINDPDVAGGDDYATVVRGDSWDFWQPTDGTVFNSISVYGAGVLRGGYAGPYPNDPQVYLPLAGPVDATLYHRLTYRIFYDGPFGLANAPGGGMVARLIWNVNGGYHDSQDMIILPGWQTVSVDLKTNPPSLAEDEASGNPVGWGGPASPWVSVMRFDPHEDPGGRVWWLDEVRLARNDRGNPYFNVRFQDNTWEAGTTAEIWADNDASGFNGTRIASGIDVSEGENTHVWDGRGVGAGTWWLYVVLQDPGGAIGRVYSTGPVDMSPPPVDPYGNLDGVSGAPGGYQLSGWAKDPDTSDPIDVHIYRDGQFVTAMTADQHRGDVGDYGFSGTIASPAGSHSVCAYGFNVGQGSNKLLGCQTATVPSGNPFGSLDGFGGAPGQITVSGWTIDPDTASPIDVHVYVNGQYISSINANIDRPDIGGIYPAYGAAHGYSTTVAGIAGTNTICTYGINSGVGINAQLGCRVIENTWRSFDSTPPVTTDDNPADWQSADFNVTLSCSDSQSGCRATYFKVDGGATQTGNMVAVNTSGNHVVQYWSVDNADRVEAVRTINARLDRNAPLISNIMPSGWVGRTDANLQADISDALSGIDAGSIIFTLDGFPVGGCSYSAGRVSCPVAGLSPGDHTLGVQASDNVANSTNGAGSFKMSDPRDYYFTWYDDKSAANWIMMGNPAAPTGTNDLQFDLWIAGQQQSLAGVGGQTATPGESIPWRSREQSIPAGLRGGPIVTGSITGDSAIVSQRSLWKSGNSLEEVLGIEESSLSDRYVWSWYDNRSPGWMNWVMVANPGSTPLYYEIRVAGNIPVLAPGQPGNQVIEGAPTGTLAAGQSATSRFSLKGGPVEVRAWTDNGKGTPADIVASQRVLSNAGTAAEAFNEVTGTPYSTLSDDYLWSWYDNLSGMNWILIANPDAANPLYYEITVGGQAPSSQELLEGTASGTIAPGSMVTPRFRKRGGPVEVRTFDKQDPATRVSKTSIASQRVLWGPSFEEVPGYPASDLASVYHWTWYDERDPGTFNWVLVANSAPGVTGQTRVEIRIAGQLTTNRLSSHAGRADYNQQYFLLEPDEIVTPQFARRGGPVEVKATDPDTGASVNVISSQRVLWHGYFNEVLGTVLN